MTPDSVKPNRGFTIVELLIVVVVIAILAAITIVAFSGIRSRAIASALQADLTSASKQLKLYQIDYNAYPSSIDTVTHCPVPADDKYCMKVSAGNDFISYTVNNATNPQTFTLDIVNTDGTQYYITESSTPTLASDTVTIGAITGTLATGSTVTAGALTPGGATVNRQWQRSTTAGGTYTNIAGATSNTYTIAAGDATYYLRVSITGTGSYVGTSTSPVSAMVTTPVTAVGTPTGTTTVGQTLTAGARTPSIATVNYQWRRNGTAISGATSGTYVLVAADVGLPISVVVTGTGNYSSTATSGNTANIAAAPVTAIAAPTGTTTVGSVLTAGARTPAAATVTYQWRRDGVNISGATAATYTTVAGDAGTVITVVATGTGGYTGTVTSPGVTIT